MCTAIYLLLQALLMPSLDLAARGLSLLETWQVITRSQVNALIFCESLMFYI